MTAGSAGSAQPEPLPRLERVGVRRDGRVQSLQLGYWNGRFDRDTRKRVARMDVVEPPFASGSVRYRELGSRPGARVMRRPEAGARLKIPL